MNNIQRAKLDTCNRIQEFTAKNATTLATIQEFAHEQEAFATALATINSATQVQSATQGATSNTVQIAKETMAKTVTKYALRGMVKAKQTSNTTLVNHLDHPAGYITRATKTLAVQRAKEIKDQLHTNLATLTNIDPDNITEIDTAITAYDLLKDSPVIAIQERVATGTNPLPLAYTAAFTAIDNMHDLINSYFAETNHPLVDQFTLAKQIIATGIHHTGVTGIVLKDGHPVKDVTIAIEGTTKTAVTDMDGHYTIARIKTGGYNIHATNKTGENQSKTVHITKANFETLDFAF
jgi:hypothetical protein